VSERNIKKERKKERKSNKVTDRKGQAENDREKEIE
jgi:hypothetical protein